MASPRAFRGVFLALAKHAFSASLTALTILATFITSAHAQTTTTTTTTQPQRPDTIPPKLWQQMQKLDAQIDDINDMRADFVKHKQTPLLKRPLTSKGAVRVKGRMMRWDTEGDRKSTTLLRDGELRLYQPQDKRLEVYPLQERFAMFGASPMPRLTELVQKFDTTKQPAEELFDALGDDGNSERYLALRLVPKDEKMREHVRSMALLVDRDAGRIQRLRLDQGAGESIEYRFTDMRTNVGLDDDVFELNLPDDVETVRPLEGEDAPE